MIYLFDMRMDYKIRMRKKRSHLSVNEKMFIGRYFYEKAVPLGITVQKVADYFKCSPTLVNSCITKYDEQK